MTSSWPLDAVLLCLPVFEVVATSSNEAVEANVVDVVFVVVAVVLLLQFKFLLPPLLLVPEVVVVVVVVVWPSLSLALAKVLISSKEREYVCTIGLDA